VNNQTASQRNGFAVFKNVGACVAALSVAYIMFGTTTSFAATAIYDALHRLTRMDYDNGTSIADIYYVGSNLNSGILLKEMVKKCV